MLYLLISSTLRNISRTKTHLYCSVDIFLEVGIFERTLEYLPLPSTSPVENVYWALETSYVHYVPIYCAPFRLKTTNYTVLLLQMNTNVNKPNSNQIIYA